MAKGLRSTSKRRYRAVKRQHVQQVVEKERLEKIHGRLQQLQQGVDLTFSDITPLNAFLHPGAYGAVFPQHKPNTNPVDFRSEKLGILAGLATSHNRRKYSPEEEEDFMKKFGHLPGKTEDPRTQKLRRKVASPPTQSASSGGSAIAAGQEEHEMEENMQHCDSSRDEGMAPAGGAAAVGGAKTKGAEKSAPFAFNTCSSLIQSMMLTPEMEEMMKQRRKAETGKIPVQVNKLKREAKRSSIRKKTQKPHKKKH